MSASDWEEIRRLAADFQRCQLSSTIQRLSERNCIEIVNKLIDLKLIKVIYTQDGKEYVTPKHLAKDIKDELFIHGGRISLSDLQQATNVDYSHVEVAVKEIMTTDKQTQLVLGDLISVQYTQKLAQEINDQLHEQGHVTISELVKSYDLPGEFLSQVVSQNLGRVIDGFMDSANVDYLYTESAILRHRATIRGLFSAITRPTSLMSVRQRYSFPGDLFYNTLEKLVSSGRLSGSIFGGHSDRATYIPDIYSRTQNEWVDSFFKQNGYLNYDTLNRLGMSDAKGYIRRRYGDKSLIYLPTCCVDRDLCLQLEACVEEALSQDSWVDVMPLLPSIFSDSDVSILLSECLKKYPKAVVICDTFVFSQTWLHRCEKSLESFISDKAIKDGRANPELFSMLASKKMGKSEPVHKSKDSKKEQRRKKAAAGSGSTKSGGGVQGREIKSKSTKKKYRNYQNEDDVVSDEDVDMNSEVLTVEEISALVQEMNDMDEATEDLVNEISRRLLKPLTNLYQETAMSTILLSTGVGCGSDRRKTHVELQDKICGLWVNACLFQKGITHFQEKDEVHDHLSKHLLKTVCASIVSHVMVAMATDHMITVPSDHELSIDERQKLLSSLPQPSQGDLVKLNATLNGKDINVFFKNLDILCDPKHLGILLKKPDKKKEKQLMVSHKESLLNQLTSETDPAMALHLVTTLLFLSDSNTLIHAPGRCIPHIISHLSQRLPPEKCQILRDFQELIVLHLKCDDQSEEKTRIAEELQTLLPRLKELVLKTGNSLLN